MTTEDIRLETSKARLWYHRLSGIILGFLLIIMAIYFYFQGASKIPGFIYALLLLIIAGVLCIVLSMVLVKPMLLEMGSFGIKITKGSKIQEATWPEVMAVETLMDVDLGTSRYPMRTIIIQTQSWKYKIATSKYPVEQLKLIMVFIGRNIHPHTMVNDTLGWLEEAKESKPCPTCNCKMKYYEEHNRWYCENCREYK